MLVRVLVLWSSGGLLINGVGRACLGVDSAGHWQDPGACLCVRRY